MTPRIARPVTGRGRRRPRAAAFPLACLALAALGGRALAQKSPTAQAALLRAEHDLMNDDVKDAAAEMETAVRFEPRFAFGWYLLASTSRRIGDYDRAVAAYRRYQELRPDEPEPLFGIGLCLEAIGDHEGAIASLRRYVERETRPDAGAWVEEAKTRLAAIEKEEAAPDAASARAKARTGGAGGAGAPAMDPAADGARLIAAHQYAGAIAALQTAVKDAPVDAKAWYDLAFALRESGQLAEAAKAYERYITLKPDDPDPYYGLGQVLLALDRPEDALTVFRAYVKLEHRKTEQRWVTKAREEIIRIEAARKPPAPLEPKPLSPAAPGGATTPPAPTSPPPAQ